MSTGWDGAADGYLHVGRVDLEVSLFLYVVAKVVHLVLTVRVVSRRIVGVTINYFCLAYLHCDQ